MLQPEDFGRFSLAYLVYALGCSVLLSTVCESSARGVRREGQLVAPVREYLGATGWMSVAFGLVGLVLGVAVLGGVMSGLACGVAIATATFRVGGRFREVQSGS